MSNTDFNLANPHRDALKFTGIYFFIGALFLAIVDVISHRVFPLHTSEALYRLLADGIYLLLTTTIAFALISKHLQLRYQTLNLIREGRDALQESSHRLSSFLLASPTILHAQQAGDGQPLTTWVSENVERITGYTMAEAMEAGWWQSHLHPEDREQAMRGYAELLLHGHVKLEYRFVRKDGNIIWVLDEQGLIKRNDGVASDILGAWTDITDRKLAELSSRESKAILHAALDQSETGIVIADAPNGNLRYANRAALRIRGENADTIIHGVGVNEYTSAWQIRDLSGAPLPTNSIPLARAILFGERNTREIIIRRGTDDDRAVIASAAPIFNDEGAIIAAVVIFLDITDLKQSASDVHAKEIRFIQQRDALAALTGTPITERNDLTAALGRITEIAAKTLGVERVSIWRFNEMHTLLECFDLYELSVDKHSSGVKLSAVDHPDYFRAISEEDVVAADDARTDPRTSELTTRYLSAPGITSMMDASIHLGGGLEGVVCNEHVGPPRQWHADEKTFVVAIANMVSLALEVWERCQAERNLLAAQKRLQRAVNAGKVGLWDWDLSTNEIRYSLDTPTPNDGSPSESVIAYEAWARLIHTEDAERVLNYIVKYTTNPDHPYSQEFRLLHDDGTYRWILAQGLFEADSENDTTRILGSHLDITDRKSLEAEFFQAQRMESVGRLAGGVAHDFNNLLTVISGYSEMALMDLNEAEPLYNDLVQVRKAADRAANLTRQLLAFSRRQVLQPKLIDLNQIISDAESMLKRLIGEDIEFLITPAKDLGQVIADPGQMEQVIMNLVINSRDAMPKGGRVMIETSIASFDETVATRRTHMSAGTYVCLAVSDTGEGMDKATQERIFEPFFTTKAVDKGTGLGLATVYGIVKQSGGNIVVYSELGHGSTFRIYLPRVESMELAGAIVPAPNANTGGSETVLLVEDEEALRILAERFLVLAGYKVLAAANGADTLAMMEKPHTPIDILLTDVIMPGISGSELARQLGLKYPGLKVLYMSGYTDTAIAAHGVLEEGVELLNKPFTSTQLTQKIRDVLDGA